MRNVVITGYASIDYPAVLDGFFQADHTVLIKQRSADAFPRPGGCPIYVARPLAAAGAATSIVTWVGADDMAAMFRDSVRADGISTQGVATIESGVTPMCFMIYQQDGSCCCCFDPGLLGQESLDARQTQLLQDAELVGITVGPAEIGLRALGLVTDETAVAWIAKNDPISYSEALRTALGKRVDYVFCNAHERPWIDAALEDRSRPDPLIIETNGAKPVKAEFRGHVEHLEVPPLRFNDASGAGDTLAGGCLAAIIDGETDPGAIAAAGIAASHKLLEQRTIEDE